MHFDTPWDSLNSEIISVSSDLASSGDETSLRLFNVVLKLNPAYPRINSVLCVVPGYAILLLKLILLSSGVINITCLKIRMSTAAEADDSQCFTRTSRHTWGQFSMWDLFELATVLTTAGAHKALPQLKAVAEKGAYQNEMYGCDTTASEIFIWRDNFIFKQDQDRATATRGKVLKEIAIY
ncbi:hypothetical protein HYFRA_00011590 [Hymenoscyphus fraxineus]|uniref:Uncharacterized protein n=1 Tax=Hymenoscyphus fraxineus TaxID=746836 RepID=A0A9N9PT43_9HELO|nr:hypothetical protein HYFRA_00011590 [Hymenoscyphus fraxineus]